MKNMKKFITLCGFLILGSTACGDADVVKAEAINEQTTDTSGYTITIPSEISFSTDKTNFDISAGLDKSTQIIITASSQNGFNLTNRDDTIPYSISDNLITLSNSRPDISNTVSQSLNVFIDKSKSPMYGGDYKDTLTFNIQEKQLYTLNVNGLLDGNTVSWLNGYGTFGIKINGRIISNLTDFYQSQAEGTTYEIFNIKATDGKHYIGDTIIKGTFDSPYQEINLKFDTNKLTLNYHADGAQSWNDFQDIVQDVSNIDVVYSETKKYGDTFDSQDGLVNVNRLTKKGYTAVANTWTIKEAGNKKVMDNVGLAKMEDVAEYCGVLDKFKKNDVTVDLYPIWEPLLNTITYDANGGTLSTTKTQQFYTGTPYKTPENSKSFSGTSTDDCEDLGYYNYTFGNKLTISTKIRFNSSDDTLPQKLQEFFCNYEWGGFGLGLGEDARPFFSVYRENKDDYDILRSKTKIKPNETYWITGVYDGPNNMMSIYINGEKTNIVQLSETDNPNIKVSPWGLSLGGNPTGGCHYNNLTKGDIWKCGL